MTIESREVDIPEVLAEVAAAFERYEDALVHNKLEVLAELFWNSPTTLRYGIAENLRSYEEICAFRSARSTTGLMRRRENVRITTFGRDFAVANTDFYRDTVPGKVGRQSQTWVRMAAGWRIVAAHVSMIELPK